MIIRNIILFTSFIGIASTSLALAQTSSSSAAPVAVVPQPKVKTGVIATSGVLMGTGPVDVNTGNSSPGDAVVAISGGVSKNGEQCTANLQNANTEKAYRVRFDVTGNNKNGNQAFKKPFSGTVPKAGKLSKSFPCKGDVTLKLNLKSAEPAS